MTALLLELFPVMTLFNLSSSINSTTPMAITKQSCDPPPIQDEDPFVLDHILYSICIPIVCSLGVFAALICVIVFTRPQMRSSLNIYLAGLSLFDLVLLAMSLLIYPPMSICLRM